jgi:hypothetical protein
MLQRHRLTRPIPPPQMPEKYDPRELRVPADELGDAEADFWDELDPDNGNTPDTGADLVN